MGNSSAENWRDFWEYVALFFTCTLVIEAVYVMIFLFNYMKTRDEEVTCCNMYKDDRNNSMELKEEVTADELPQHWDRFDPSDGGFKIVSLGHYSPEFHLISSKFEETMPQTSYEVTNIERIQNEVAWTKYNDCMNRMTSNSGRANELQLFHGTRTTDPASIYKCETGFDMRFSKEGLWGRGNYFAVKASYSHDYAHSCPSGLKQMFMASVLTGHVYDYGNQSKQELRRPPSRSADSGGVTRLYDTVSGETHGSRVYITYENDRAYPAYLITYKPVYNMPQM